MRIGNITQSGDLPSRTGIEQAEFLWFRKQVRFKFVQLNEWDETRISDVLSPGVLQLLDPLVWIMPQLLGVVQTGKIAVDRVEVDHTREENIPTFFLRSKA